MRGDNFAGVGQRVLKALLGPIPTREAYDEDRGRIVRPMPCDLPRKPARWPEDLPTEGAVFLYRHLARLLAERGRTVEAANEIRRELQVGTIRVASLTAGGDPRPVEAKRWLSEAGRVLLWDAGGPRGSGAALYVIAAPVEVHRPEWLPGEQEQLKPWCAKGGPADAVARECLRAKGDASPSETRICETLAAMWTRADRQMGSAKHIANHRRAMRESGEAEPKKGASSKKG